MTLASEGALRVARGGRVKRRDGARWTSAWAVRLRPLGAHPRLISCAGSGTVFSSLTPFADLPSNRRLSRSPPRESAPQLRVELGVPWIDGSLRSHDGV